MHYTRSTDDVVDTLHDLLSAGASFNLYMFVGGSNGGVNNGALMAAETTHNGQTKKPVADRHYRAQTASYDYDAPVSETGKLTPKFFAIRDAIRAVYPEAVDDSLLASLPDAQVYMPPQPVQADAYCVLFDQ